jgi:hypothetical protein
MNVSTLSRVHRALAVRFTSLASAVVVFDFDFASVFLFFFFS